MDNGKYAAIYFPLSIIHFPFSTNMLSPFGSIYGAIANARNSLYRKGIFKSFSLGAPTVSVGNITVGGTGKTPLVAFIAEILNENGEKVCILTRGYGRENERERVLVSDGKAILADVKQAGDEPLELAQKLLEKAVIVADANRVEAGFWACEKFGITAFVLDDGFQHQRIRRDLDIVCVDATNPFGNGKVLPSGVLRESLANLKRADAIVITRANLIDEKQISNLKSKISEFAKCPIFLSENKISNLVNLKEFPAKAQRAQKEGGESKKGGAFAFCALGNPNNFFEQLKRENFNLVSSQTFPDHHFYKQKDIAELEKKAKQTGAESLITTAKDAVKLKDLKFDLPCFVAESEMIFQDEKKLREIINAVFNPKSKI
ncbi:MAG TPA: tetraacyldisaccharide 4'-kinase [Pyrinomonadaceae bacterium]|nr:tetraacyldisaccharide 4'-kinase [Pyrinomonadaceae bacterium]